MKQVVIILILLGAIEVAFGQGECSASSVCANNYCCSKWGFCGVGDAYCGDGCLSGPCTNTGTGSGSGSTSGPVTTTGTSSGPSPNWPNGPIKALYVDSNLNWNTPAVTFKAVVDAGYNLVILAFIVGGKPLDAAGLWGGMSAADQQSTIQYAHDRNARIIASAGGATENPYNSFSGAQYGTNTATWAKNNHLDGVDFDLENFGSGFRAGSLSTEASIAWVADATNSARSVLGANGIITHAPQPPYFGPNAGYADAYTQIYKKATSINFLLVQYYNNGPATTYENIFQKSNGGAVLEIASGGVPLSKIVVGKPVTSSDAGSQYMSASDIHNVFQQAAAVGWKTGIMGWQWHDPATNSAWAKTIFP